MLGTPPSVTCSVHWDPDQYRCWCRPVGSVSQPGAIPTNVVSPDALSTVSDAWGGGDGPMNDRVEDGLRW
jgi:hypothetical protein